MKNVIKPSLKNIRLSLEISQKDMAEKVGVKPSYYSDVENGRRPLTNKFITKITDKFPELKDLFDSKSEFYSKLNSLVESAKARYEKISSLRKETFLETLKKDDRDLINAMQDLPELVNQLKAFIEMYDLDTLESLSSIGAAWAPGENANDVEKVGKLFNKGAYEENMKNYINSLSKHKISFINLRSEIWYFLDVAKHRGLDKYNEIKLPKRK